MIWQSSEADFVIIISFICIILIKSDSLLSFLVGLYSLYPVKSDTNVKCIVNPSDKYTLILYDTKLNVTAIGLMFSL